ncbi:glyoxalase/bleomycin resistance/dioxygenase family protein [Phototrophicus methaneseepsis]|uniref:Glyoxalase/bleomycin resistance/dioxygenase family protein n=1 Tax=Phototrophicus methaneseepsis TaxID=2710758 RepID=A0A7S8ECC2_9CHLR|nr:glyoxalase/bleomycin resistance/dioxygenase family protein [Phototrophicus methaneseepsis]QPC84347.1 glyoxalase/bleomycin resistance/dioxygenase family protein [Phototrophicus methaneseepsis]
MEIVDLRLKTHDLEALRGFYDDLFDLALLDEQEDVFFTVGAGETRLTFEQGDEDERYLYHFAFNIPNNQLTDAKVWLAQKVELLEHNDDDEIEWAAWDATALYFRDPVGNVVELIARRTVDNDSDLPFSGQSIVRVSEIGLSVKNVREAAASLQQTLLLDIYDETGDTFCALGSPLGLFIIVKEGHPWFPTQDAHSKQAPMYIGIKGTPTGAYTLPNTPYQIEVVER